MGPLNRLLVDYSSTVAWGILTRPQVGGFQVAIGGLPKKAVSSAVYGARKRSIFWGSPIIAVNPEMDGFWSNGRLSGNA
jgi:hypothetical protein